MRTFSLILTLWTLSIPRIVAQPAPPPDLDAFMERILEAFDVPGGGLAIVKDGQIVTARGYGLRQMDAPDVVDAHTLFGIASNSKAFTAAALGVLVEEGKVSWDEPVATYLPWFRMSDPYVSQELTVRDLLVHRSGLSLGAGDLLWWPPTTYDREEIVRRLRFLPLTTSFRSSYAYDNVLYIVAGEVIEAASGLSWEDFVQTRILDPVGMKDSSVLQSEAGHGPNVGTPHAVVDGKLQVVKPFDGDNANPAAGINASAADMARWMITLLDSGRVDPGTRIFSRQTTAELWSPVTPQPLGNPPPELSPLRATFRFYALGFEARDYRGHKLVTHTGGLPGYLSRVALLPELKLGVAVLTNQESGAAFNAAAFSVLDHYLDATDTDWVTAYKTVLQRTADELTSAEAEIEASRNKTSRPSLSLSAYAGTYRDAWYGDVRIEANGPQLTIRFLPTPSLVGTLEHWQYDSFVARWSDRELRADAFVTFALDPHGQIEHATMKAFSPATDFSFDFHDLFLERVDD